ncbi:MAG: endopeptidase La [Ignavibacteria bacterium CG1_02_37_35]|nr:MAG: endopeptidase La [Ignavibacteria bacterium CG1_02_37_35]
MPGATEQPIYPIIAVRDGIVFPNTENVLVFGRNKSIIAVDIAMKKDKRVVLLMQKNTASEDPKPENLHQIGIVAEIQKIVPGGKGEVNALIKGVKKIRVIQFTKTEKDSYLEARVIEVIDDVREDEETQAMIKHISGQIKRAINFGKSVDLVFLMNILNLNSANDFSYQIAMVLEIKEVERQALLEETVLKPRLIREVEYVNREVKILEIEQNISSKTQKKFEKGMKENFLREKMKTIEEELGSKSDKKDLDEYQEKIIKAKMPKEVQEKAVKELKRLQQMSQFNPEASYVRTYLDWLVELPWSLSSENNIDLKEAQKILDADHFGLKKIKERILEYLAVIELKRKNEVVAPTTEPSIVSKDEKQPFEKVTKKKEQQPTILCFVGPPGVGKTSLGKSIARALERKFVKMSLGGIRDEAEIRGHRRTYVGALPGRIIQGIKQAGTNNPVFMLDEIDKVGRDYRGDPSSALLEALDPEQNNAFSDHYLELDFDLSDVFFITTANILDTIPDALLDRLEVIHFPGYTEEEKFNIANNYLESKQIKAHSLSTENVQISDKALRLIIRRYTREAGVRELERQIATISRKVAREVVENKFTQIAVAPKDLSKYLGPYKYSSQMIEEKDTIGIATGLAWTQAGGDVLFIEVAIMPGKGGLTLTGHLGDVMKESCQAALSYIRPRWQQFGLEKNFFSNIDIHVHVPEGAVPKDGPSAGVTIAVAMVSALTKTPVRRDVGMTGEITLRGRVLEIGGIKEKTIAAHRAGIKTVIMPKENKKDLEELPKYVLDDLKFIYAHHADDVLNAALVSMPKKK